MLFKVIRGGFLIAMAASACLYGAGAVQAQTAGVMSAGVCNDNGKTRKCDGFSLVNEAGLPLQDMWHNKDFGKIEEQAQVWCRGKDRFPDGQWKLIALEDSFRGMFNAWKQWDQDRRRFEEWNAKFPNSLAAKLTEAIFWRTYAWNARGGGYANSVSKEGWELFHARLKRAESQLRESKDLAKSCPLWHSLMIDTLLESGRNHTELLAVYKDGAALFPGFHPIHFSMGRALSPRWGGDEEIFDKFARGAASITKDIEGDGLYARLYWTQDGNDENAIQFSKSRKIPEWRLIKSGFEDLMKRYPESTWNMNKFASFACRAGDKATYLRIRQQLGTIINSSQWPSSYSVDVCDHRFLRPA